MKSIVGISDMKVSNDPRESLITYSLGSCIGLAIYDFEVRAGGILHYLLPTSDIDKAKAKANPFMFGDMAIPILFKTLYKLGAIKRKLKVVITGGAQVMDQKGFFNIGKRNYLMAKELFWKNNVIIDYEDVGGVTSRTVTLHIRTGNIIIKTSGQKEKIV